MCGIISTLELTIALGWNTQQRGDLEERLDFRAIFLSFSRSFYHRNTDGKIIGGQTVMEIIFWNHHLVVEHGSWNRILFTMASFGIDI